MAVATDSNVSQRVRDFLSQPKKLLIGGEWVAADSGELFDAYDPATGDVLARCAEGRDTDIDKAVKAARKAFTSGPWHTMKEAERSRLIWKLGDLILENLEELAELDSLDNGKPVKIARIADVPLAANHFHYYAGWCTKILGDTIPINMPGNYHVYTRKEPVGVVGQIIPWNFPLLMAAWKLAPALATGCTIILKPAEQTPLSAIRLGELICEAGFPDGVVNVITGYGETAGAALSAHDDVDKVAFTGSTEVGKMIVQAAAGNLKKVSLELGGKSPNVVFKDADIESAVQGAANAIFFNHGQCCCAGSRLFVEKGIFDKVIEGVADVANKMKLGPGMADDTDMGPLVSQEQLEKVASLTESGLKEGAKAVCGAHRKGNRGYFFEPTVLVDTQPAMKVCREEIFGPVVTATPFSDNDELVAQANDTYYGLAAGVWTKDLSKAHQYAQAVNAGTVWINCYNVFDAAMPFGGYKESGWGREMGRENLDLYLQTKSVCIAL